MKIILIDNVERIGKVGQVLTVKDGFARNYLLPKKLAVIANAANLKKAEHFIADAKAKADRKNEEYRQLASKIAELEATFTRRAEEDGKLFGSVSETDIVAYLAENNVPCQKTQVELEKHIKNTGTFEVKIAFTHEISASLKVNVVPGE